MIGNVFPGFGAKPAMKSTVRVPSSVATFDRASWSS
jgi:hypothetical protein